MKYVKLGNSNLKVSLVCIGFGDPENGMHTWTLSENESIKIITNGLDNGINFYDDAIGYQNGTFKQYLGKAIRENSNHKDIIVVTKFLPHSEEDIKNNVTGQAHIHNMVEKNLSNLDLDCIDLFSLVGSYLH